MEMELIRVCDYAKQRGISIQAVNQTIRRYQKELSTHIVMQSNIRYLDKEAVAYLDSHRRTAPIAVYDKDAIKDMDDLAKENKELLTRLTEVQDKLVIAQDAYILMQNKYTAMLEEKTKLELLIAQKDDNTTTEATESPTEADKAAGVVKDTEEAEAPQKATEEATEDVKVDAEATEAPSDVPTKKLNRLQRAWKAFTSKE